MKQCIIVDLDGTVADLSHRLHYIKHPHGQRDYDSFFANVDKDTPYTNVIDMIVSLSKEYEIVFASGRSDSCVIKTTQWIDDNIHIDLDYNLYMRKQGDHRPDYVVKKEILQQIRDDGYTPVIAIDDRDSICKLWVEEGITCLKHMNSHVNEEYLHENLGKLFIMVGPSGAGKSNWLDRSRGYNSRINKYKPLYSFQVISSDELRMELCDNMMDQSKNEQVFKAAHALIHTRIIHGLDTWFDATNIRDKDRRAVVECVPSNTDITYLVVDRPLEEKIRDDVGISDSNYSLNKIKTCDWRNDVKINHNGREINLIEKHHNTFKSNLTNILKGDNYSNVKVIRLY